MSRFCVIEGTKITLNNKETLPIEKIKAGQEILSFNLNTLQKSQKNDTLLKLRTDKWDGVFQEDLIKNIWKNEVEEYYSINNKLKITGDHIVLGKRDNTFYWTTVDKLLIGDYLFTDQNIFEKIDMIILIKEKVKVYNLQVNDVYNYFANSYLIHNGAPCGASCAACGAQGYSLTILAYDTEHLSNYTITVNSDSKTYGYMGPYTQTWTGLTGSTQSWAITAGSYTCYISGLSNCTTTGDGQSSTGTYLATITDTSSDAQFRIDIEQ
jgi:hypothetical protein